MAHITCFLSFFFLSLLTTMSLGAQTIPYTEKAYSVRVEKDIPYGTVTGFAGEQVDLVMDVYKPIGDGNCRRPLLLMAHGGGFIAGDRHDYDVVSICQEMAARGYVAASIEYRLGMHPLAYYEPYAFCNDGINPVGISKCIYMSDTLEFYRALYRATQDMRGAIRFLKGRNDLDSTDLANVFAGGSSAGAITALHVALIDQPNELPPHIGDLPDAPLPDSDLGECVPSPGDRTRPALGDPQGSLHLNGYDSHVQGVAEFMGAVFNLDILAGDSPPLYLYHRTDDLVVPSNTDKLFGIYPYCLNPVNLCQPLYTRPWVSGSEAVKEELTSMGNADFFNDILDSYGPANGDDCLDNPPGHSIDNIPLRCENLSGFFAPIIASNGNHPDSNCVSATRHRTVHHDLRIYPNPVSGHAINISCEDCATNAVLKLMDSQGRIIAHTSANIGFYKWQIGQLPTGVYILEIITDKGISSHRVVGGR